MVAKVFSPQVFLCFVFLSGVFPWLVVACVQKQKSKVFPTEFPFGHYYLVPKIASTMEWFYSQIVHYVAAMMIYLRGLIGCTCPRLLFALVLILWVTWLDDVYEFLWVLISTEQYFMRAL